jgi:hypothetical protein
MAQAVLRVTCIATWEENTQGCSWQHTL